MQTGISLPHFRHLASREAIHQIAQSAEALGIDSSVLEDATLDSMIKAMEVLAQNIRPRL